MKKNLFRTVFIILAVASAVSACVRDTFRYYGYEDQLEGIFPVDSIESGHTWTLTNTYSSFVRGVNGASKLQILSGNPFNATDVEILAEASTTSGEGRQLNYVLPQAKSQIYAAALDADGNYMRIVSASANQDAINLGSTVPTGTPNSVSLQRIFYCFEAEYPNPGDWDYNDVVLSVTKEINANDNEVVDLHVTLHAVGYLSQIAAAIRLVGYQNSQVTISRDEASTFVREPDRERVLIPQTETQLEGLTGHAVINLFDDAHLAMYHLLSDGTVGRYYFNTIENPNNTNGGAVQPAVTVTYHIDFKDAYQARNFTLAEIDPFIVVQYGTSGSNYWEVHTHPYKLTEILYNYYNGAAQSYNNGFSWALAIPYAKFRYPLEGQTIGERKNTIVAGAYQESGHSFGEWILNHTRAQDWYLYPADGAVY